MSKEELIHEPVRVRITEAQLKKGPSEGTDCNLIAVLILQGRGIFHCAK